MAHTTDVQYVLSLDSLDLSLLSQFVEKPYKKRMLWSKPFMDGESTYCQVNIASEEIQDEDYTFEQYETYKCHICNIDVPQKYFKQHSKSKMHHNFRKLTERVLENLAKQIYFDIDVIDNNKHELTKNYEFCETCCKVVLKTYKQKHYKSLYHLKCVENEKFTETFIEIYEYVKEDKILNDNETPNNSIQKKYKENNVDQSTENNIDIEDSKKYNSVFPINTVLSPEFSSVSKSSLSDYNSTDSDEGFTQLNMSEVSNFQLYLKEMIAKYKLQYKVPIIEDNSIVIVTPKGLKEKIAVDNFHGILNNNSFVYCQLCKSWDYNYIIHIKEEDHVRNIIQPVNDNFAREVVNNDKWDHCLLCNIMVLKGPDHAALYHKTINEPKTSKIVELPIKPVETSKQTFCDVCNRYIDTHNFLGHIEGNKHKLNIKKDDSSIYIKKEESTINIKKEESCINIKKEESCFNIKKEESSFNITKGKSSSDVKLENDTLKSNDDAQKTSTQKSISVTKNNASLKSLYCEVCKVNVPKGGLETHEKGKSHNKCAQTLNLQVKNLKNQDTLNATASGSNLSSSSKIVAVNSSQKYADELTTEGKLLEYYNQMSTVSKSELDCQVCHVIVPNLCKDIIAHVEGTKHKNCLNELLHMYKIEKISIKNFYCKLCDLHTENFINHIYQDEHHKIKFLISYKIQLREYLDKDSSKNDPLVCEYRKVYKDMLEQNKIKRLTSMLYYCHICSISLPWRGEIDHLLNEQHQRFSKISKKHETFNSKTSHNSLPNMSKAAEKLLTQQNMKEFTSEEKIHIYKKQMACVGNVLECLVCDVKIANHDKHVIEHVEGSKHKNNTTSLLLKSSIIKKPLNLYYCEICKSYFEDFIQHINKNENHKRKYLALNKTQIKEYVYDDKLSNHSSAQKYKQIHKDVLEQNQIRRLTSTLYYCNICSISLAWKSEIDHVLNEQHILLFSLKLTKKQDNKSTSSEHNSPNAEGVDKKISTEEFTNEEKLVEYKKQMTDASATDMTCLVCYVKVPNTNIIEHVEGTKHNNNMDGLLFVSTIIKKAKDLYYCQLCKSYMHDFITHINQEQKHQLKFLAFYKTHLKERVYDFPEIPNSITCTYKQLYNAMLERNRIERLASTHYYCNVCSLSLYQRTEIDHMLSEQHLNCLKSKIS